MYKRKLHLSLFAFAGILALAACRGGGGNNSSSSNGSASISNQISSGGSSGTTSGQGNTTSVAPQPSNPALILEGALAADYSNMTTYSELVSFEEEAFIQLIVDDYTIIRGYDGFPDLFYHQYEGESHLYFEDKGYGDAWLKEGYHDAPLGLEYTYPNFPMLLDEIAYAKANNKINYSYYEGSGFFAITDAGMINTINRNSLQSTWNNRIDAIAFVVDATNHINYIQGLDFSSDEYYTWFEFDNFGTTSYYGTLPPKPNSTNVRTYAEYSNTAPWVPVPLTGISIAFPAGCDGSIDIGQTIRMSETLQPNNVNTDNLTEWHTDDATVVEVNILGDIKALKPGTAKIWSTNYSGSIKSNELTVTVKNVAGLPFEDMVHDFIFNAVASSSVTAVDRVASAPAVTISSHGLYEGSASSNALKFPVGNKVVMLSQGTVEPKAQSFMQFDFAEAVDGIAFNLSFFYENDNNSKNFIKSFVIQTSDDGTNWKTVENLLPVVKDQLNALNVIQVVDAFQLTKHVRLYADWSMIGNNSRPSFSQIRFYRHQENEVSISDADLLGEWSDATRSFFLVIKDDSTAVLTKDGSTNELWLTDINGGDYTFQDDLNNELIVSFDGSVITSIASDAGLNLNSAAVEKLIALNSLSLSAVSTTINAGDVVSLNLTVDPLAANIYDLVYVSSNPSVATVSNSGVVTAIKAGAVTITVSSLKYGKSATLDLTINAPVVPTALEGEWIGTDGDGAAFTLMVDNDGTAVLSNADGVIAEVSLVEINTNNYKFVDIEGKILMVEFDGTDIVSIDGNTDFGFVSSSSPIVNLIPIASLSVSVADSSIIALGEQVQLNVTVNPTNANAADLTFTSATPAVATVNATGLVTAVSRGTSVITVRSAKYNKQATITITVTSPAMDSNLPGEWGGKDSLANDYSLVIAANGDASLTVGTTPYSGFILTSISSNNHVFIDAAGKVLTVTYSASAITAIVGSSGLLFTANTIAKWIPITSISLAAQGGASTTINVGATLQLVATVNPVGANVTDVKYTSSDATKASVSASGLVTANAAGTVTITVSSAKYNKSASIGITVNNPGSGLTVPSGLVRTFSDVDIVENSNFTLKINADGTGYLDWDELDARAAITALVDITGSDYTFVTSDGDEIIVTFNGSTITYIVCDNFGFYY